MDKVKITSRVLKTENINWRELAFIQQDNFKELSSEDMNKLKASLVTNNFIQPFYVWEDADGIRYCLDGKHRTKAQEELILEGVDVPYTLPATFIDCKDKKEAARLVLIFSSFYAKITQKGLFDFKELYDLDMIELKGMMNLPEFSMPRFEQKFDLFGINEANENDDLIEELPDDELIIVNKGDIFRLGRHRLACGSFKDLDIVSELMGGLKARIINTDPPYNLPADYIGNVEEKVHEDFIEGHGEMTDDEYVNIRRFEASKIINLLLSIILLYTSGGLLTNSNKFEEFSECVYLGLSMLPAIMGIANIVSVLKFKHGLFDKYLTKIFDCLLKENSEKEKKLTK